MEILLWWLIVYFAAKGTLKDLIDLPFALRGRTPPGHQYRMAKLNQRAGTTGGRGAPTNRTGVGRYFAALVRDAADTAHQKHAARHQVKAPVKAKRAADKTKARLDRKTSNGTGQPDRTVDPDTPAAEPMADMQPLPEGDPVVPRPTPVVIPHRTRTVEVDQTAPTEPGSDTSIPAEHAEATVHPFPAQPDTPAGEVISLTQAIQWCELMEMVWRSTCARMEAVYDTLVSTYGLQEGPVIEHLGKCWQYVDAAAHDSHAAAEALRERLAVKDAYNQVNGPAGSTRFIQDKAG